jgi:molecular chaperone GrpE (heat shock protein)
MAIADLLNQAMTENIPLCSMGKILKSLNEKDREAIEKAQQNGVPANTIFNVLKSEGYKISTNSLYLHIKGGCRCPKE